jgi:hypothetical protein
MLRIYEKGIQRSLRRRVVVLTVPFGLLHICLRLNSFTRASSGVIVAHLIPTLCSMIACAASTVTWSSVWIRMSKGVVPEGKMQADRVAVFQAEVVVFDVKLEVRKDNLND